MTFLKRLEIRALSPDGVAGLKEYMRQKQGLARKLLDVDRQMLSERLEASADSAVVHWRFKVRMSSEHRETVLSSIKQRLNGMIMDEDYEVVFS